MKRPTAGKKYLVMVDGTVIDEVFTFEVGFSKQTGDEKLFWHNEDCEYTFEFKSSHKWVSIESVFYSDANI